MKTRMLLATISASGLALLIAACESGSGSRSPTAPSPAATAGGIAAQEAPAADCADNDYEGVQRPEMRLKVCAPSPSAPPDNGPPITTRTLALEAANPGAKFVQRLPGAPDGNAWQMRFEVRTGSGTPRSWLVAQGRGTTTHTLPQDFLEDGAAYTWRVRAELADGKAGPWSRTFRFATMFPPAGFRPGGSPNAPFTTAGGDPPNMRHVVERIAREHPRALAYSCTEEPGGSWEFMDRVVEALRAIDGRWGYNCKRGDCRHVSVDVVDYYRGRGTSRADAENSTDVAIIDIIFKVCGPGADPRPAWIDQTQATAEAGAEGRWRYPR